MRFLIGILTGAIVTLLVATAMDAPTHPLLNNTRDLAASGWDKLIHATSSSLFEPAQDSATTEAEDRENKPNKAQEEHRANATPAPDAIEPAAGSSNTAPTQEETTPPTASVSDVALDEQAAYAALAALEPATALMPPDPVAQSPSSEFWAVNALNAEAAANADQPVWVPFHSLMSAEGFASRLSRTLDHEFRVVRQGAGAYQVVFDAANEDQRALILAQVTEITGQ